MTEQEKQIKEFNDKWGIHRVVQEALKTAHIEPAPRTLEMLNSQQKEISEVKQILAVQGEKHHQIDASLQEIKVMGKEILTQASELNEKVGIQNGRVRKLEDWTDEAKKIIQKLLDTSKNTDKDVSVSKAKIWAVITMLTLLGGAIITLSIMAIDSKIEKGIDKKLKEIQIK